MSRKLIKHLMRFHGVDTDLFQQDAEWELAEGLPQDESFGSRHAEARRPGRTNSAATFTVCKPLILRTSERLISTVIVGSALRLPDCIFSDHCPDYPGCGDCTRVHLAALPARRLPAVRKLLNALTPLKGGETPHFCGLPGTKD